MTRPEAGLLFLRVAFGAFYIYTGGTLIQGFPWTVKNTALLVGEKHAALFSVGAICLMIGGGLLIVVGLYGEVGAAMTIFFTLPGTWLHRLLRDRSLIISDQIKKRLQHSDDADLRELTESAWSGNHSSALKNLVLVAIAIFIMMTGTGPHSLSR